MICERNGTVREAVLGIEKDSNLSQIICQKYLHAYGNVKSGQLELLED